MDSDVSLHAPETRWMTYAELAEARGIDKLSAIKLATRRRWPRQKNNQGKAQVCVPLDAAQPDKAIPSASDTSLPIASDISMQISDLRASFDAGLAAMQQQLDRERSRADQAEALAYAERESRKAAEVRADQAEARAHEAEAARQQAQQALQQLQQAEAARKARGRLAAALGALLRR